MSYTLIEPMLIYYVPKELIQLVANYFDDNIDWLKETKLNIMDGKQISIIQQISFKMKGRKIDLLLSDVGKVYVYLPSFFSSLYCELYLCGSLLFPGLLTRLIKIPLA